jgi:hypothetical protein
VTNAWHYINQYTIEVAGPGGGTDANAWQNLEAGLIMSHKLHGVEGLGAPLNFGEDPEMEWI